MKIGVALPLYKHVESIFLQCLLGLLLSKHSFSIQVFTLDLTSIEVARNQLVKQFLQSDCTHLLFLDSDMVFPSNTIEVLLSHEKPVVSGLCFLRKNIAPSAYRFENGFYKRLQAVPTEPLAKVDGVGMACILIQREVLETLFEKYSICFKTEIKSPGEVTGEDIYFCNLCRQEGIALFLDTRLVIGHMGGIIPEELFRNIPF